MAVGAGGVDIHLIKPITGHDLLRTIRRSLATGDDHVATSSAASGRPSAGVVRSVIAHRRRSPVAG